MSDRGSLRLVSAVLVLATGAARADDRQFTFLDMAKVTTPGMFEFEQWATWETHTNEAHDFNLFTFKEELEYGVNERLMLGFDVPEWHFQTGPEDEKDGPRLDTIGGEIRYLVLNPTRDFMGLAFKGEVELGPSKRGLEARVIAQKNFDKFTVTYNARLEADWGKGEEEDGGSDWESEGEIVQALGGSLELSPNWFVGGELVWEIPLPDWHTGADQNVFLGPNFSYHSSFVDDRNWALTVTALARVTDADDEPAFQLRAIFEIDF